MVKSSARPVRALVPMALDGVGPSFCAIKLSEGIHDAGYPIDFFTNRQRMAVPESFNLHVAVPWPFHLLPYKRISRVASSVIEARYERSIMDGDIAWLWPSASLQLQRRLSARGIPIVLEGINTRMAHAKEILDSAYSDFGATPSHGITRERIDEEEEKIESADAIFAPSRAVELALRGTRLENRYIATSYGVDIAEDRDAVDYSKNEYPVFLFCAYACVRKGIHHVLEAWRNMPGNARLRLVGRIEPIIAERFADVLNSERVESVGFVSDLHPHFATADIFLLPSLEEGDPLVTYLAALHGLPIVATPMGGGRMGDTPGVMRLVKPGDIEDLRSAMQELAASPERRAVFGQALGAIVNEYTWPKVGARRARALQAFFSKS